MKKITILMTACMLLVVFSAGAREFNDLQFPDQVAIGDSAYSLRLNGIGMRTKFVFDIYIGALYTEKQVRTRDDVLAQGGANRVLMHFVYDLENRRPYNDYQMHDHRAAFQCSVLILFFQGHRPKPV